MLSANFKPKRTAAASRGSLATARGFLVFFGRRTLQNIYNIYVPISHLSLSQSLVDTLFELVVLVNPRYVVEISMLSVVVSETYCKYLQFR